MTNCTHVRHQRSKMTEQNARMTFSQSLTAVKFGFDIHRSRVSDDEIYYSDVLLSEQLLPTIHQISGEFVFQQDSAPSLQGTIDSFLTLIFHKVVKRHA